MKVLGFDIPWPAWPRGHGKHAAPPPPTVPQGTVVKRQEVPSDAVLSRLPELPESPYHIHERAFWLQTIDRVVKTTLQALVVFFVSKPITEVAWGAALSAILVTITATLLLSILSAKLYESDNFFIELVQRAARTFVAFFAGTVIGLESFVNIDWAQTFGLALSATVLSVLTSLGSKNLGDKGHASAIQGAEINLRAK